MRARFEVDRTRGVPRVLIHLIPDLQRTKASGFELHYSKIGWAVVHILEQASCMEVVVEPATTNSVSMEFHVHGVRLTRGLEFLRGIVDRFETFLDLFDREKPEVELNVHCLTADSEWVMRMLRFVAGGRVEIMILTETGRGMEKIWNEKVPIRWGSGVVS